MGPKFLEFCQLLRLLEAYYAIVVLGLSCILGRGYMVIVWVLRKGFKVQDLGLRVLFRDPF